VVETNFRERHAGGSTDRRVGLFPPRRARVSAVAAILGVSLRTFDDVTEGRGWSPLGGQLGSFDPGRKWGGRGGSGGSHFYYCLYNKYTNEMIIYYGATPATAPHMARKER
jgi:hypothetical protein